MRIEELLEKMQKKKELMYKVYREAELTESEMELAHIDGILEGMDIMINLVKEECR